MCLSLSASVVIIIITRLLAPSKNITRLLDTSKNITQYFNHYCYSILPPVHSKLMSHYQLSNFAIYGLEHSETGMNS